MSEGENPNPKRITEPSWWFMQQLLALEPNTANGGIYVNKPGFHGTRAENIARSGAGGNYSIRHPLDLQGPDDKAAAYDWTHNIAHGGNYTSMAKYGVRLLAAFNARDPRLYGWHEAQGQTDLDKPPEELNFDDWSHGVPSDSHSWHWHFSEHRAFTESLDNKWCMLSILSGQSLDDYLAKGGKLMAEEWAQKPFTDWDSWHEAWRVQNQAYLQETVADGPEKGKPLPFTTKFLQLIQDTKTILAQQDEILKLLKAGITVPAKVDLTDASLAAVAKAVADEDHRRSAD